MEAIKQVKGSLIGRDSKGNVFKLNGNGTWVKLTTIELFKIL